MSQIFHQILTLPILNLLLWLYDVVPGRDIGIAIILLTILIKAVLYPFAVQQIKQQRALQSIQPKIEEVRSRLKDDKEAQAKELMALYQAEKVNPVASCLPLLVQLPVFIALYHALRSGLTSTGLNELYPFVPNPGQVNAMLLGFVDLSRPNYVLAVLAGLVQYVQTRQMLKPKGAITPPPVDIAGKKGTEDEDMAAMMNKQMMYIMPAMTVIIGISLPGGLALYWLTMSLLTVLQQWYTLKRHPLPDPIPTPVVPAAESKTE
jgi:YidC/Oxa1 family membrane protein insertase